MTSDVAGHGDTVDRYPTWILGDVFMVQHSILLIILAILISSSSTIEKCVFCLQGGSSLRWLCGAVRCCK
jgi:hypothetical protein